MRETRILWREIWNDKATAPSDFQATGRGNMGIVGFLYTLHEIITALDIQPDDEILDIGCGTGIIPLALSPWVKRIIGIDLSNHMVFRARENCLDTDNIYFCAGDIRTLPIKSNSFNKIFAYSVLQYLEDTEGMEWALKEVSRILSPGGIVYLAANPDPQKKEAFRQTVKGLDISQEHKKEALSYVDVTLWVSQDKVLSMASKLGLRGKSKYVHPRIWQSFYMYDLFLWKSHG